MTFNHSANGGHFRDRVGGYSCDLVHGLFNYTTNHHADRLKPDQGIDHIRSEYFNASIASRIEIPKNRLTPRLAQSKSPAMALTLTLRVPRRPSSQPTCPTRLISSWGLLQWIRRGAHYPSSSCEVIRRRWVSRIGIPNNVNTKVVANSCSGTPLEFKMRSISGRCLAFRYSSEPRYLYQ